MARQNVVVSQEGTPKNDAIEVQGPADVTASPRAFQDPQGIQRRLFQAMSFTAEGHYLFVCDIESNWSRWSHNAVVDFGLPGDMMYDAGSIWIERIHPSDREAWSNDIDQVFSGEKKAHRLTYRAKNASGRYVTVDCQGVVMEGGSDEPRIFAGTIVNRGIAAGSDPITGIDDVRELNAELTHRRENNQGADFIVLQIGDMSEFIVSYGIEVSNGVIARAIERIGADVRFAEGAHLYRSYGLQYVLVLDRDDGRNLQGLADDVLRLVTEPVRVGSMDVMLPATVAIARYPRIAVRPMMVIDDLFRRVAEVVNHSRQSSGQSHPLSCAATRNATAAHSTDAITGLPRVNDFLRHANDYAIKHPDDRRCMVYIDLGHMRIFNDWYGKREGDALLGEVGDVLRDVEAHGVGFAGHWGQDDFMVCMPFDKKQINGLYYRILAIVSAHDDAIGFLPAFGVFPLERGADVSFADCDKAKFALGKAKHELKDRIQYFDVDEYQQNEMEHSLLSDFQRALNSGNVTFFLQPQCDISTGRIVGAEALARWRTVDGGYISPAVFVPVLERNGFVSSLDRCIWKQVFKWIGGRLDAGDPVIPISINVSHVDIMSMDVAAVLDQFARRYRVPARYVKVEITESAFVSDCESVNRLARQVQSMGYAVYMDDFGSGQSSLSMLRDMNIDCVKLDGCFMSVEPSERGSEIVQSAIDLVKKIKLPVVVEGVETKGQVDFLKNLGCRFVQGFYYHKPMPPADCEELIASQTQSASPQVIE